MAEPRPGTWTAGRAPIALRWVGRLRGAELAGEVAALFVLTLVATGGLLLASVFPVTDEAPIALLRVLAAGAALTAAALFVAGPSLPRAALHAGVAAFVVGNTVLTASVHTAAGFMMASRAFQWLAVYAALFLTPREARRTAAGITVACVASLAIARVPGTFAAAVIMCVTVWVATALLSGLAERLRAQADTDHLTGLLNRSGFAKAATREHALAGRTGAPLALAVIDLDDFKRVNDAQGHAAGDRVLAEVADAWARTLRPGDVLGRLGGDEFLVMLPATAADEAHAALARLRAAHPAAWSAGIAEWGAGESLAACLDRADRLLYDAKTARRREPLRGLTAARA